jgi:hypothetical protein
MRISLAPHSRFAAARARWAGTLRVTAYLGLLSLGLSYWCVRSAYAETEQKVWKLGQQLLAELGPSVVGEPQGVLLNGQALFVASRQSELAVRQVLDRFAAGCSGPEAPDALFAAPPELRERAAQPNKAEAAAPAAARKLIEEPARFGVLRAESEEGGQLACLARRARPRGLAALVEGAREFLASGDLSHLGDLRYVAARKLANGKTQVLAVWSEGEFRLGALFPEHGDAPGSDMPEVTRPPESTRSLCALAPGHSFGLRLYDSRRPVREVVAFYDRALPAAGWEPLPLLLEDGKLRDGVFARAFTRGGQAIALAIETAHQEQARGTQGAQGELASAPGGSAISLVDLGSVQRFAGASSAPLIE